jgi:hypothetical protein
MKKKKTYKVHERLLTFFLEDVKDTSRIGLKNATMKLSNLNKISNRPRTVRELLRIF